MIFALKAGLRARGYGPVLKWIAKQVQDIPTSTRIAETYVRATERAVATAAAIYPGRARCLEQSLVLYYVLRRRGVEVHYRHGVMPYPFEAHTWIEYRGEVINDIAEHANQFIPLPDQLP